MKPQSIVVVLSLLIAGSCGTSDEYVAQEKSLEYKLATIHEGGYVRGDSPLVSSFATVLNGLQSKCPEGRQQLADMGVGGQQMLRDGGIEEPLLTVFANWGASIPDEVQDGGVGPCADILAAYVVLRTGR